MKIVVATIGSRGDVQPYIYFCQGLREAGHEVVLATNPTLCSLVVSHGVAAVPIGPAVDMGAVGARLLDQSFNNMWIGMIRVMQFGAQLVEAAYSETLAACRGADVVITSDTACGIAEAERLQIPWVSVTLQPARVPVTNAAPSFLARTLWSFMGRLFVAPTNRFRRRVGAPPVKDIASMMSTRLILLPVSRHVAPPDPRWPRHVHQTGYWFPRSDEGWVPPHDLLAFLEGGDTPLAVSLGVMGMSGRRAQEGAQIILGALERTEVRAIVQGWDEALRGPANPQRVYFAGAMPHRWLFDRVSMVIHHGGFGTTAATLRAGVPGLVVPHVIDQFYWGQRVTELGVSPGFISRGKLRVGNLSEAIQRVRQDEPMRERASELGRKIRSEADGVTEAVRVLEGIY
jgi:UDP:flavonoid glycosyltransferase YjiC (YdhE family)